MTVWTAGTQVGPYVLVSPLGAGGMGEVWEARDDRLNRTVAIKRLAQHDANRFAQEARAIAALNHPHICQIYDVGPDYLVMEYIEGAPLRGPLPTQEVVRLGVQIASALEEAHGQHVLHRDLKPGNILVTSKGAAKLLDFGLARLMTDSDATRSMASSGTPLYMSPEQVENQPLDARSDIFSFGAVLYELLSGRRAFDTVAAVLRDIPAPLEGPVAGIALRCLAKQPTARFQTIAEVKGALGQLTTMPSSEQPSIAVLPFADMSAGRDHEWFSDGLAEEIINALTRVPGLKVIARTSAFAFKGKEDDIRRIAGALGVAHVLEGSVRKAGDRIRVTAQLITATDGSHLWSERYDRDLADIFAIQDDIARSIAAALEVKLAAKPADIRRHTPTVPAYEALLRGRHHTFKFTPGSWRRAKEHFAEAMALDPLYAEPHADAALADFLMGTNGMCPFRDVVPLIRAEAGKALELDPTDPGPHALLGAVAASHDYDWKEAGEQFRLAMAATRVSPNTRWAYASFYLGALGRFRESVAEMERAVEQDPLNLTWRAVLSGRLHNVEMSERAHEEALKARDLDEHAWFPHFMLAESSLALGRLEEAIAESEAAHKAAPWHSMPTSILAAALARSGEKGRAEEFMAEMGDSPLPIWGRVLYHLLCSEIDQAADWYERMISQREPFAVIFARAPVYRALTHSARWPALAKRMNLPE